MKKSLLIVTSLLFTLSLSAHNYPDSINNAFIYAASNAKYSVVSIAVYKRTFRDGHNNLKKIAFASGTIISKNYIVTNYHVVRRGNYIEVSGYNNTQIYLTPFKNGDIYLADEKTDIAVLKINRRKNSLIKPIKFEDSNNLLVGEWVLALGNPYGLAHSITAGIVSSKGRDNIGFTDIENFIQSDVPINPGNSGGPLVNLYGKLVGINTAIRSVSGGYQGISFTIPSNIVKQVCSELINHGRVRRGWIGFLIKEEVSRITNVKIIRIISIMKNSPAKAAYLQEGDIIRKVANKRVASLGQVINIISNKPVGTSIIIQVSRNGRVSDHKIVLRERKIYQKIHKIISLILYRYGIEIDENAESGEVIITNILPRGIKYNIKKGDIILSLNDKQTSSLEQFLQVFTYTQKKFKNILILRGSHTIEILFDK